MIMKCFKIAISSKDVFDKDADSIFFSAKLIQICVYIN